MTNPVDTHEARVQWAADESERILGLMDGRRARSTAQLKKMSLEAERLIEARKTITRPKQAVTFLSDAEVADAKAEDSKKRVAATLVSRLAKRDLGGEYRHPGHDAEDGY